MWIFSLRITMVLSALRGHGTRRSKSATAWTLGVGAIATADEERLPATTQVDIMKWLCSQNTSLTLQQMKVYKSFDAHNYFISGWVCNIVAMQLKSEATTNKTALLCTKMCKRQRDVLVSLYGSVQAQPICPVCRASECNCSVYLLLSLEAPFHCLPHFPSLHRFLAGTR